MHGIHVGSSRARLESERNPIGSDLGHCQGRPLLVDRR